MNNNYLNKKEMMNLKPTGKNAMKDTIQKGMNIQGKDLMSFLKQYSSRMSKYVERYFGIKDNKNEEDKKAFISYVTTLLSFRNELEFLVGEDIDKCGFFDYCGVIETKVLKKFNKDLKEDEYKALVKEMSYYFIYSLSYYIYMHWDRVVRNNLFNEFLEIMNSNEICKEQYLKLNSVEFNHAPFLEPEATYCCPVIMSVLINLDDKSIQRKVRKIIYEYSENDYKKLDRINLKETQILKKNSMVERTIFMRDFAFTFIMNYLEDRLFLAPYSAFVRLMDEELETIMLNNSSFNKKKSHSSFIEKCEPVLKEMIQRIKEDMSIEKSINDIELSFSNLLMIRNKSSYLFYGKELRNRLLDAYYKDILDVCSKTLNRSNDFLKMNDMERINFILCVSYSFYFIGKLEDSEEYINKSINVDSTKIINEKDEEISKKDKIISELKNEIEENTDRVNQLKKLHKDKLNEKVEKTRKIYIKEIADLNKEIENIKEENRQLLDEKEELFKLREFIFNMENENEFIASEQESLADLSKKLNIVFVGGHEHVQRYMKNAFPNITYLVGDSESFDDRIIGKADYVLFCYKHMNHGVYQKVMKTIISEKIKFDYVTATNVNRLESEILAIIEQGGKTK